MRPPLGPLALCLLLVAGTAGPARAVPAATSRSATVREILDGDALFIDSHRAALNERAWAPQQLRTDDSRARLDFDTGAAGRLNRFSLLRLGSTCFLLRQGQILVSGGQSGCVRSARLSVRGTNYVITLAGEDAEPQVLVLEGTLEVSAQGEGPLRRRPGTLLPQGSKARLAADGRVLALERITAAEVAALLRGPLWSGFREPLPHGERLGRVLRRSHPSLAPLLESTFPPAPASPLAAALLARVNRTRSAGGLAPLVPPPADVIASDHPYLSSLIPRLLASGRCDHSREGFETRRRATRNDPHVLVAEICGLVRANDPIGVVTKTWEQWQRSPAHLAILRDGTLRSMNCASATAEGRTLVLCHLWMAGGEGGL
ncbi:MAG: hypothetical protein VKI81_02625 [Synechococcaceae cyanobacterium]|nr:hypothetical protein [Synechococcaceae cyanobacterium]